MSQPKEQGPYTTPAAGRACPMMYSTTCSYAIRAMCRLALLRAEGYVTLQTLCKGSDLPTTFVAKILGDLTRGGLLRSAKGRGGGFALACDPGRITLCDIVDVIDGDQQQRQCVVGLAVCDDAQPCPQHEQFKQVRKQVQRYLASTTLDEMSTALSRKLETIRTAN